jgi:hypothetical protein
MPIVKDIVKDKVVTIHKAHEISNLLLQTIQKESLDFASPDDPAELIYLNVHVAGALLAKMCILLEGYGQTYAIPNMRLDMLKEWIVIIASEYLEEHLEEHLQDNPQEHYTNGETI